MDWLTGQTHKKDRIFLAVLLGLAALKMMLIWGNEMVTEGSDSILYLLYAHSWFYHWKEMPFRGFVFPIFVALFQFIHIPFRLGSEAVFIAAAGAFAGSLPRVGVPRALAAITMAGIIFHPASFQIFDMPMSEGLFAIITLTLLATLVWALTVGTIRSRMIFAALIGVEGALLMNERGNDDVLIYGMLAYCALALAVMAAVARPRLGSLLQGGAAITVMILAAAGMNLLAQTANYATWGYFGPNETLSKGEQRLMGDLVAIDTGEPPIHRWIPITNKALQIAYGLSPTLATYRHAIEVDFRSAVEKSAYTGFSRTGIKGQFDLSDITELVSNVLIPPPGPSGESSLDAMKRKDDLHAKMAQEIEDGLQHGRAKRRLTVYLWNPTSPILIAAFKQSMSHISHSLFYVNTTQAIDNYPFYGSLASPLYDKMLTRRADLVKKGPLVGYLAIDLPDTITSASLSNNANGFLVAHGAVTGAAAIIDRLHRGGFSEYEKMGQASLTPVGADAIPSPWKGQASPDQAYYWFSIPAVADRFFLHFGRLTILDDKGRSATCDELEIGPTIPAAAAAGGPKVSCLITSFDLQLRPWHRWGYAMQGAIFHLFNRFALLASAMATGLGVLTFAMRCVAFKGAWSIRPHLPALLVLGAVASIVIARMTFFSLIDATVFPINDDRHLFDSNILLAPLVLFLIYELIFGVGPKLAEGLETQSPAKSTWTSGVMAYLRKAGS